MCIKSMWLRKAYCGIRNYYNRALYKYGSLQGVVMGDTRMAMESNDPCYLEFSYLVVLIKIVISRGSPDSNQSGNLNECQCDS